MSIVFLKLKFVVTFRLPVVLLVLRLFTTQYSGTKLQKISFAHFENKSRSFCFLKSARIFR